MVDATPTWLFTHCAESYLFVVQPEQNLIFWAIWWQMLLRQLDFWSLSCRKRNVGIVAGRITHNTYECAPGESRVLLPEAKKWRVLNISHATWLCQVSEFDVRLCDQLMQEHTSPTDITAPGGRHACVRAGQIRRWSLKVTTSDNSSGQPDAGRETINKRGRWEKMKKKTFIYSYTRVHTRAHEYMDTHTLAHT